MVTSKNLFMAFLFSLCYLSNLNLFSADYAYRELGKELSALRARENGNGGFQGCKNKAICGYTGFYLAKYSSEGFCDDCEFKEYPDRFTACLFCRKPIKMFCFDCSSPIAKQLTQQLAQSDSKVDQDCLLLSALSYLDSVIQKNSTVKSIKGFRPHQKSLGSGFLGATGAFYLGAKLLSNGNKLHIWSQKLVVADLDKRTIHDSQSAKKYIEEICQKYNLVGPETGSLYEGEIPENALMYEEIV